MTDDVFDIPSFCWTCETCGEETEYVLAEEAEELFECPHCYSWIRVEYYGGDEVQVFDWEPEVN